MPCHGVALPRRTPEAGYASCVMAQSRPPRPRGVSRLLRQEAGFGCCICGKPIIEYHHIERYDPKDPSPPEKMLLLCLNHHHSADRGTLARARQYAAKRDPHNKRANAVAGVLDRCETSVSIGLGGNSFLDGVVLMVDQQELLAVRRDDDGALLLSANIYDQEGRLIAVIDDNEWIAGDPLPWDVDADVDRLWIRRAMRDIQIGVQRRADQLYVQANLWHQKEMLSMTPTRIVYKGSLGDGMMTGSTIPDGIIDIDSSRLR